METILCRNIVQICVSNYDYYSITSIVVSFHVTISCDTLIREIFQIRFRFFFRSFSLSTVFLFNFIKQSIVLKIVEKWTFFNFKNYTSIVGKKL